MQQRRLQQLSLRIVCVNSDAVLYFAFPASRTDAAERSRKSFAFKYERSVNGWRLWPTEAYRQKHRTCFGNI